MSDKNDAGQLTKLLAALIESDVVETISSMPHLSASERRVAIGRALKKNMIQDLMAELVQEEVSLAAASGDDISDELATALLETTCPISLA